MVVNRRDTIATLFSAATSTFLATRARSKNFSPIGLQLYTVRALLEQDFEGTLARIATLGYQQVEFAGVYGSSLHQTATILKRYGLFAPSGHVSYAKLEKNFPSLFRQQTNWVRSLSYARISMKETVGSSVTGSKCAIASMRSGSRCERQG